MDHSRETTIVISAEAPELGSAVAEGPGCVAEDAVGAAVLSIGAVPSDVVGDDEVHVQGVDEIQWEVSLMDDGYSVYLGIRGIHLMFLKGELDL